MGRKLKFMPVTEFIKKQFKDKETCTLEEAGDSFKRLLRKAKRDGFNFSVSINSNDIYTVTVKDEEGYYRARNTNFQYAAEEAWLKFEDS